MGAALLVAGACVAAASALRTRNPDLGEVKEAHADVKEEKKEYKEAKVAAAQEKEEYQKLKERKSDEKLNKKKYPKAQAISAEAAKEMSGGDRLKYKAKGTVAESQGDEKKEKKIHFKNRAEYEAWVKRRKAEGKDYKLYKRRD